MPRSQKDQHTNTGVSNTDENQDTSLAPGLMRDTNQRNKEETHKVRHNVLVLPYDRLSKHTTGIHLQISKFSCLHMHAAKFTVWNNI